MDWHAARSVAREIQISVVEALTLGAVGVVVVCTAAVPVVPIAVAVVVPIVAEMIIQPFFVAACGGACCANTNLAKVRTAKRAAFSFSSTHQPLTYLGTRNWGPGNCTLCST